MKWIGMRVDCRGNGAVTRSSQFVIAKSRPDALSRLFCFPHAGGGPVVFHDWGQRFDSEIECVALQYAGRGQRLREQPATSVEDLVGEIAANLAVLSDKPFALYGHSFGGIVAFELARELRSRGLREPHNLFVGASRPPHLELPFPKIHHLCDEEFIENVQARYGGIPAAIYGDAELREMFVPAMRADFTAYESYQYLPGEPLDCPIAAFAGAEDKAIRAESLAEWALHTIAEFNIDVLPGGHFFPAVSGKELTGILQTHIAARLIEGKSAAANENYGECR
jgi:medium-chain acyl-[acyl-carrier-protein] hydrolase